MTFSGTSRSESNYLITQLLQLPINQIIYIRMTFDTILSIRQILTFRLKDHKFPMNLAMMTFLANFFCWHRKRIARVIHGCNIFMTACAGDGIAGRKVNRFIHVGITSLIELFSQMALTAITQLYFFKQR